MGLWLNAWAGDHAGSVVGRQPYRALVAVTEEHDFPMALFQMTDLDGTPWYPNIEAICLTPGAMSAMVTKVETIGYSWFAWSLEVTPCGNWGGVRWEPGVHLFAIILDSEGGKSSTIATVVVPPKVRRAIELSDGAIQTMLTVFRQRTRDPVEQLRALTKLTAPQR